MNAIAAEATPRIQEFSQQNLSNLCWAFGKLGHFDSELMAAIAERSIVLIKVLHCALYSTLPVCYTADTSSIRASRRLL
jgi:hypothetical protein